MKKLYAILLGAWCVVAGAAEVIPSAPQHYFNDYANAVSATTATRLNVSLEDFERQTSSQILVAIFPKMQSDSSIEDYTVRVAQAWRVGQKAKDNGAVMFVFIQDRKLFIQVGYGLEGALPDAICKRIIDEQITPRFKAGDFDGGLSAGVQSIIAAAKGEYKGTGRTVAESSIFNSSDIPWPIVIFLVLILILVLWGMFHGSRQRYYGSYGWSSSSWSAGSSSGGGGGFSGGGGSFGGGGAGGSW